ncbi:hypothetical protein ADL22_03140 [Streptomyces sp. NRRL F-4489]|nr:hypothetical protein ADL22_03140 [Streptomyces sp. NRRL F-4489]
MAGGQGRKTSKAAGARSRRATRSGSAPTRAAIFSTGVGSSSTASGRPSSQAVHSTRPAPRPVTRGISSPTGAGIHPVRGPGFTGADCWVMGFSSG